MVSTQPTQELFSLELIIAFLPLHLLFSVNSLLIHPQILASGSNSNHGGISEANALLRSWSVLLGRWQGWHLKISLVFSPKIPFASPLVGFPGSHVFLSLS